MVTSPPNHPILNDSASLRSTWAQRARVACGCTTVLISLAKAIIGAAESRIWFRPILAVTSPPNHPILNDSASLRSTWAQRAWVACGCTTVLISLAKAIIGAAESHIWFRPILAALAGYILADLGSGVYYWGIYNYGSTSTPIFGAQIDGFQGHHKWPWQITRTQFANNFHTLARAVTFTVLPMDLANNNPIFHAFVGVFSGCILFSQHFHVWAHTTKSRLPPLVIALQDMGLLLSCQYTDHHRPPYNNNYCIVSGLWNKFLDQHVFKALETILFFKLGVRPRSWSEPNSGWTEETKA